MENQEIIKAIKKGKIFIYPTDTIYGLGCNALVPKAVEKIRKIKYRDRDKPLSVIAPSIKWIKEHLIVDDFILDKYLPGPYTLILTKLRPSFLLHVSSNDSLGVRIPRNNFTEIIQKSNIPFITTSVNFAGEKPAINLEEISEEIKSEVDIIISPQEKLSGKPSRLVIDGEILER